MESLTADNAQNATPVLSPVRITIDEDDIAFNSIEAEIYSNNADNTQLPAKNEKISSDEGFCCVMSMHDGVVL